LKQKLYTYKEGEIGMATTVAKISELPAFTQGGRLVAGAEGLGNEVRYVTVMEVPDFNISSLNNGVFILTTLFAYHESTEQINHVMEKLCKQKVAGIAVKLERFIVQLPQSAIDIADEYNVPLFTFGKITTFRELISQISAEIIQDQRELIDGINKLNKALVNSVLRGDKIEVILKLLCNRMECYCACVSLKGELLSDYSSLTSAGEAARITNCFGDIIIQNDRLRAGSAFFSLEEFCVFPCSAYEQTMGFLIIRVEGSIGERQLLFAKELVSFLSIRFLEEHLKIEAEQRMSASILDEILFGHHSDETVIADRLKLLGFYPQKNHLIVRLSMRDEKDAGKSSIQRSRFDYWKAKFAEIFTYSYAFWKGAEIVVLASFPDKSKYCWEDSIRQTLSRLMEENHSDVEIDLGYSLVVKDLCKLPECYEHAKKAINYGRAVNPEKHIYSYNDYLEIGLISHSVGTSESIILKEKILTPILEYDKKFNAQLWVTLEKSLMHNSLDAAAKGFFIHISTLRYRLDRIKLITGVDFFTPHGKFLLYLAYVMSKVDSQ